jgi:spermidine synthase
LLLTLNTNCDVIGVKKAKGKIMNNLFEKWNSFSMVRVWGDKDSKQSLPFGWGMSPSFKGEYPPLLNMDIDADAYTPIIRFDGDYTKLESLKYDVTSFIFYLLNNPNVLIIGPGGGRDILTALIFGAKKIYGIEVNPIIVNDVMGESFKEYSGNLYSKENVEIIVDDARSYIKNSKDKFDVIQASFAYTLATAGSGARSLCETNLYTIESIEKYINHLSKSGYLTTSMWYGQYSLKLTVLYLKAAERLGIKHPENHMVVLKGGQVVNHIFKKGNLDRNDIDKITRLANDMQYEILYLPNLENKNDYTNLINSKNLDRAIANYLDYDLRPSTDDSPYFFNSKRLRSIPDIIYGSGKDIGLFLLYGLFIIAVLLTSILIILPISLTGENYFKDKKYPKFLFLLYFILLGLGFMLIEISLVQKFILFLGHPIYSITVIISSLLFFGGIGSLLTNKIPIIKLKSQLKKIFLILIGVMLFYNITIDPLFNTLIGVRVEFRILLSLLLLSILGIFMGMPFPIGIRLAGLEYKKLIPFYWALNGAFSVIGSILAVVLSMNIGFTKTIYFAVMMYSFAYLISSSKEIEIQGL